MLPISLNLSLDVVIFTDDRRQFTNYGRLRWYFLSSLLSSQLYGTNLRLVSMTNVRDGPQNNEGFSRITRKWVAFFKASQLRKQTAKTPRCYLVANKEYYESFTSLWIWNYVLLLNTYKWYLYLSLAFTAKILLCDQVCTGIFLAHTTWNKFRVGVARGTRSRREMNANAPTNIDFPPTFNPLWRDRGRSVSQDRHASRAHTCIINETCRSA